MNEIIIALVTGLLSLLGVIFTNISSNNKTRDSFVAQMDKMQALTDYKIGELTREVRAHNNFAQRLPVVEEQIKVINHRIDDLEKAQ